MRRLTLFPTPARVSAAATAALLLLGLTACSRQPAKVETIEVDQPQRSSVISAGDPAHAVQFVQGFYDIEQGSWRWTRAKFSLTLASPGGASEKGATLELKFVLPDPVVKKVGPVTLSATIDGNALPPEKFEIDGEQVYRRDIPANLLRGPAANIEFSLDKFLAAGVVAERELGIILHTAALMAK